MQRHFKHNGHLNPQILTLLSLTIHLHSDVFVWFTIKILTEKNSRNLITGVVDINVSQRSFCWCSTMKSTNRKERVFAGRFTSYPPAYNEEINLYLVYLARHVYVACQMPFKCVLWFHRWSCRHGKVLHPNFWVMLQPIQKFRHSRRVNGF